MRARCGFSLRGGMSAIALAAMLGIACSPADATGFYAGKTITFLIGGDVGGGYDVYARTIGRHLPRFIPGSPAIVPRNQIGAGSATAAAAIFTTAPADGTWIGAIFPGVIIGPILDPKPQTLFTPTKFNYVGSADSGTRVCITGERSKTKTFEDAQKNRTIMGASAAGGSTRDYAFMMKHAAGAQFDVISGYKGTVDIFLAMERGEVDGLCGLDWSSLKSQRPDWVRDKKINILAQTSLDADEDLVKMGVPDAWQFIKNEADRKSVELVVSQQVFGRPYILPPGTPDAQVSTLRKAFDDVVKDKDFLADAEKEAIDINPSSGEKVQALVARIFATPKLIIDGAKRIIQP